MKLKSSLLLFLGILAPLAFGCSGCQSSEPEVAAQAPVDASYPAAVREILASAAEADQPVLIDFHAEW